MVNVSEILLQATKILNINKRRNKSIFVISESDSACGSVRGKPSRINPFFFTSSLLSLSLTIPIVTSSGTSSPLSMNSLAFKPRGVSFFKFSRNMSPVEICPILGKTFLI